MTQGAPMPGLGLSSGPAISEAHSGLGSSLTGDFVFKGRAAPSFWASIGPLILIGGVAWLALRK